MFVKRQPIVVNLVRPNPTQFNRSQSVLSDWFQSKFNVYKQSRLEEFVRKSVNCIYSKHWYKSTQYCMLYTSDNFNDFSMWNFYFESSQTLVTKYVCMTKFPLDVVKSSNLNVHIITRRQANFEATAIFMGYVRHVLKKQIAKSDNLRVILHCIEQSLTAMA